MSNFFDQFDATADKPAGNFFDQFTPTQAPPPPRGPLVSALSGGSGTKKIAPDTLLGEDFAHDLYERASTPAIKLPKFTVKPDDSKTVAVGKEAVNLLVGIPEFAESPAGVASIAAGGVLPRTIAALFTADTAHNVGQSILQQHKDWDKYTPAQKAQAVTDDIGGGALGALLGHTAVKGIAPKMPLGEPAAPTDVPTPNVQPVTPNPPPIAVTPDLGASLMSAMRGNQLKPAIKPPSEPLQPSEPVSAVQTPPEGKNVPTVTPEPSTATLATKPTLTPALLVDGKPVTGGRNHDAILANAVAKAKQTGDASNLDKIIDAHRDDSKHVFVDQSGKVYSREEASKALGLKEPLHSEMLLENKPQPVTEGVSLGKKAPVTAGGDAGIKGAAEVKEAQPPHNVKEKPNFIGKGETTTADKIKSSASRFKPRETVHFNTPLVGPTGAKLVAYDWKWMPEEYVDKRGEDRVRRVSNWDEAEGSSQTGKNIVHQFRVVTPDGIEHLVSAESVPQMLGFAEKGAGSRLPSLVSATKTLAKLRMQQAIVKAKAEAWTAAKAQADKEVPPPIEYAGEQKIEFGTRKGEPIGSIFKAGDYQTSWSIPAHIKSLKDMPFEMRDAISNAWRWHRAEQIAGDARAADVRMSGDLDRRIKLQEKKIDAITKSAPPATEAATTQPAMRPLAAEFDNLVREHADPQRWAQGQTLENLHMADPGKNNLGTMGIKGAIARNKAMIVARRNAAKDLGLDPDKIGSLAYRATHIQKMRDFVAKNAPQLRKGEKGTGELFQGEEAPFNLAGEKGTDAERLAREKAEREADARAEEEFQRKKQRDLFAGGESPPMRSGPGAQTLGETKPRLGKGGPGAAESGEPGSYSPIQEMADRLATTAEKGKPVDTQIHAMDKAKAVLSDVKDGVKRQLATLTAVKDAMWNKWNGLPEYGDEQRAVGKWFYALQRADHEARQFAKQIVREVPQKLRREAITNFIQAQGDKALLQERANASSSTLKQGYEAAMNLTPRETEIAEMLRDYYDKQLQNGIQAGILKDGLENYITQVWKKENPITRKLISDLSFGKLQPNFKFAKKRIFDSFFEGEQAGYIPQKDAGFLVANYDQSFNKSLAARAFIKDLHEGKASDGRPLVELSGNGKVTEDDGKSILINPHAQPEELSDYRTIDHPALRGWKWATKTPEGKSVFVKGDMLVHPEAYAKLKNRLSSSLIKNHPVGRALLELQGGVKQTMLSVSGFHQVQETLHALGHRVNPTNLPEMDFSDPVTKGLVEHGLQLADYNALADFGEGLAGGGLTAKVPVIGPKLHAYNEWLFQDYIPRLKLQMAKLTLERNRDRYPNMPEDKLLELTSGQANAAFGELPYKYWGRNPTFQDALRAFALAPDFLEARARFVGRAVRPFGREQLVALGLLAATQYVAARIINHILDGDAHLEPKNAFRIIAGGHAYGLRTIPSDLLHLFTDTRGFFYNRMSPALRTATTAITGRDDRGIKRDVMEQVKDLVKMPLPISMKSRLGQKWWESFLNAFGVQEQRYDAVQTIQQKAADWKKAHGITSPVDITYDPDADKYAALRASIEDGQEKRAQQEFDKLKATTPPNKIYQHFRLSLTHPITGSRANDAKFTQSLDEAGKEEYKEALQLRQAWLKSVESLK